MIIEFYHFPARSQYHPKIIIWDMEGWDHQLMGLVGAFTTLWSHMGVGHGPNSGVVSMLKGDFPSHMISTCVIWNTTSHTSYLRHVLFFIELLVLNNPMDMSVVSRDRWSHSASNPRCLSPWSLLTGGLTLSPVHGVSHHVPWSLIPCQDGLIQTWGLYPCTDENHKIFMLFFVIKVPILTFFVVFDTLHHIYFIRQL